MSRLKVPTSPRPRKDNKSFSVLRQSSPKPLAKCGSVWLQCSFPNAGKRRLARLLPISVVVRLLPIDARRKQFRFSSLVVQHGVDHFKYLLLLLNDPAPEPPHDLAQRFCDPNKHIHRAHLSKQPFPRQSVRLLPFLQALQKGGLPFMKANKIVMLLSHVRLRSRASKHCQPVEP